jgi:hypothetical protein
MGRGGQYVVQGVMRRVLLVLFFLFSAAPALAQQCGTLSNCPAASTPFSGSELLYIVQQGVSKKTTLSNLYDAIGNIPTLPAQGLLYTQGVAPSLVLGPVANSSPYWNASGQIGTQPIAYVLPQNYGAKMDCATDDGAALVAAFSAAASLGAGVLIAGCYAINSNQTFAAAPPIFGPGGYFNVASSINVTVTSTYISAGLTQWVFRGAGLGNVVASNVAYDSVAWWGAYAAAVAGTDTVPAIQASLGSNRTIYFPSGVTYQFFTYTTNAASEGTSLNIVSANIYFKNLSNFQVQAYGATFEEQATSLPVGGCACMIFMDGNNNFQWFGGTVFGNKSTIPTTGGGQAYATLGAFVNHNGQNFLYKDIHLTGNFGMNPLFNCGPSEPQICGTGWAGDFEVNGRYENITMDAAGIGFDLAFVHHIVFDNMAITGANAAGNSGSGQYGHSAISTIWDTNSQQQFGAGTNPCAPGLCNTTGFPFTTSDDITIVNSRLQNMLYTLQPQDGTNWNIANNYILGGNATPPGYGVYMASNNCFSTGSGGPCTAPSVMNMTNTVLSGFVDGVYWNDASLAVAGGMSRFYFDNDNVQADSVGFSSNDSTGTSLANVSIGPTVGFAETTTPVDADTSLVTWPVGQTVACTKVKGSAVSLTTLTAANICSIALGVGLWNVAGVADFTGGSTTVVTYDLGSISTTSATLNTTPGQNAVSVTLNEPIYQYNDQAETVPTFQLNLSSPTTVYLVGQSSFTTSTSAAYGGMTAVRAQ